MISLAAQCIVIGPVCVCNRRVGVVGCCATVRGSVPTKLHASIYTKLGL